MSTVDMAGQATPHSVWGRVAVTAQMQPATHPPGGLGLASVMSEATFIVHRSARGDARPRSRPRTGCAEQAVR
jgi:hypothetical protein